MTLVADHTPNAQRTENLMIDGSYVRQTVTTVRTDDNTQSVQSNGFAHGHENYINTNQFGETIMSNSVNEVVNERDFGYVPLNNPYIRNINYK